MNKTELLDNLFEEWEEDVLNWMDEQNKKDNYNSVFIKDGIVDCDVFEKQDIKVLFISNEANINKANIDNKSINSKDGDIRGDFRKYNEITEDKYYNNKTGKWETSKGKMREKVCCLYQVITRDFKNANEPWKEAYKFAYMNINKTGGGGNIDHRIKGFCEEFKGELCNQIDIINPDLIVWLGCNTFDGGSSDYPYDYRSALGICEENGIFYRNTNGRKVVVIRMWHTSGAYGRGTVHEKFKHNENAGKLATKLENELNSLPKNLKEKGFTFEFEI